MIVVCPACSTRFVVDGAAFGTAGRRVRCASCGNLWHDSRKMAAVGTTGAQAAEEAPEPPVASWQQALVAAVTHEILASEAPRQAEPSGAGAVARRPLPAFPRVRSSKRFGRRPRPWVEPEPPPTGARSFTRRLGGVAIVAIAVAMVLVAIFARDTIIALWPGARPVYEMVHLVTPTGRGLHLTVVPRRTVGGLIISGSINNQSGVPRQVPPLRVTLRDRNEVNIASQRVAPSIRKLAPGAMAYFTATFEHPAAAATAVEVTFDTH